MLTIMLILVGFCMVFGIANVVLTLLAIGFVMVVLNVLAG